MIRGRRRGTAHGTTDPGPRLPEPEADAVTSVYIGLGLRVGIRNRGESPSPRAGPGESTAMPVLPDFGSKLGSA